MKNQVFNQLPIRTSTRPFTNCPSFLCVFFHRLEEMKQLLRTLLRGRQLVFLKGALNGHFYSPIPNLKTLPQPTTKIPRDVLMSPEAEQRTLLKHLQDTYGSTLPFPWIPNDQFMPADSWLYYAMIRHSAPKSVIEIGAGNSSRVMLQTNEKYFGGSIESDLIEPHPPQFLSWVTPRRVQDVPLRNFDRLQAGDILFIDSSHVSKIGSDVNHIFFEILPRLKQAGVRVHFHDIFYPFEYPLEWVRDGKAWNEAYLLRAFLLCNPSWQIELWPSYLGIPGGSIWLIRTSSAQQHEHRNSHE